MRESNARCAGHQYFHFRRFGREIGAGPDQGVDDVGQADQIGTRLDQQRSGNGPLYVSQRADDRLLGRTSLASEIQRDSPRLADANERIVTAGRAESLDQGVGVGVVGRDLEAECELVFHAHSESAPPPSGRVRRLRTAQLSTTRLSLRA